MKAYIKIIFLICYLICISMIFYSISMLAVYNELFEIFEFKKTEIISLKVISETKEATKFEFEYEFNEKRYKRRETIVSTLYAKFAMDLRSLNVNSTFPSITFIDNVNLTGIYYLYLFVFIFFLLVVGLIDRYSNRERWINRYRDFFRQL
jgi:hypothetical protein